MIGISYIGVYIEAGYGFGQPKYQRPFKHHAICPRPVFWTYPVFSEPLLRLLRRLLLLLVLLQLPTSTTRVAGVVVVVLDPKP